MELCYACLVSGYCRKLNYKPLTNGELALPELVRDGRAAANAYGFTQDAWVEEIHNIYRDLKGRFIDDDGNEVFLNMDVFDSPNIRSWFRDNICKPMNPDLRPVVREATCDRWWVFLSIIRADIGVNAELWGVRPANDNF